MATAVASKSDAKIVAGVLVQWVFGPVDAHAALGSKPKWDDAPTHVYNLYNRIEKRYLQHEQQHFGINLGWTDDTSARTAKRVRRWFLTKRENTGTPIHYGDHVALGNGMDPSFIRYHERTWGINLDWSKTPVYEWQVLGGPKTQPVTTGAPVALYNTVGKECLIFFDRSVGGDIGWPSSETWSDIVYGSLGSFLKDHWKEGVGYLLGSL